MTREGMPTRADYAVWQRATTRWADIDVYGHMNNARYFELIDTAVNVHLAEATGVDIRGLDAIGIVAEVSCRYFREVGYPEPVDLGLVVERLGTSSVTYRIGIFQGTADDAAAEGRFVHVYVPSDRSAIGTATRRSSVPIPGPIRDVLEPLVRDPS